MLGGISEDSASVLLVLHMYHDTLFPKSPGILKQLGDCVADLCSGILGALCRALPFCYILVFWLATKAAMFGSDSGK